jgi:hypothetical protein
MAKEADNRTIPMKPTIASKMHVDLVETIISPSSRIRPDFSIKHTSFVLVAIITNFGISW